MSPPRPGDPRAAGVLDGFRRLFGGGDRPPVPVEDLAEDLLGLRVRVEGGLPVSGMLVPAERLIVVSAAEPPERRRFTVAHEIGHWVVHCEGLPAGPIMCRPGDAAASGDPREREANVFAADLLMPEALVRDAHRALPPGADASPTRALAAAFDVSEVAMGWRLYNLGLIASHPPGSEAT